MQKLLALAFVLGACTGDDVEPQFKIGPCDYGSGDIQCHAACRASVPVDIHNGCPRAHTVLPDGQVWQTSCFEGLFEWEGLTGCCVGDGWPLIEFLQCD